MLSPAAPLHPFPVPAHREQGRSTPSLGRASSLPSHSTAPACSQREGLRPRAEQPAGPALAGAAVTTAMAGWVPANLRIFPLLAIPPVPTVPCRTAAPFGLFWVPPRFCPSPCPISPYSCTVLRWPSAALGGDFRVGGIRSRFPRKPRVDGKHRSAGAICGCFTHGLGQAVSKQLSANSPCLGFPTVPIARGVGEGCAGQEVQRPSSQQLSPTKLPAAAPQTPLCALRGP